MSFFGGVGGFFQHLDRLWASAAVKKNVITAAVQNPYCTLITGMAGTLFAQAVVLGRRQPPPPPPQRVEQSVQTKTELEIQNELKTQNELKNNLKNNHDASTSGVITAINIGTSSIDQVAKRIENLESKLDQVAKSFENLEERHKAQLDEYLKLKPQDHDLSRAEGISKLEMLIKQSRDYHEELKSLQQSTSDQKLREQIKDLTEMNTVLVRQQETDKDLKIQVLQAQLVGLTEIVGLTEKIDKVERWFAKNGAGSKYSGSQMSSVGTSVVKEGYQSTSAGSCASSRSRTSSRASFVGRSTYKLANMSYQLDNGAFFDAHYMQSKETDKYKALRSDLTGLQASRILKIDPYKDHEGKNQERVIKTRWYRLHGDPSHHFNGLAFKEKELASFDPSQPRTSKFKRPLIEY